MPNFSRGSEWRRWDLHIHTPGTQKNDQFNGATSEEKWENFYNYIDAYIGDGSDPQKAICVVGITDYLSIDNYKKVITDERLPKSVKLVLPNVELRMTPTGKDSPINIHCIFSPDIVDQLEDRFFGELKFPYHGIEYSAKKSQLEELGRNFQNNQDLDERKAFQTGIGQFVITLDMLKNVFKKNQPLKENTIIVVSNRDNDGASGLKTHTEYLINEGSQLEATRHEIYRLADMIFSSNAKDRKYFLGNSGDSIEEIIRLYGSLKPCIHGSDAHCNERIFEPDEQRYCWIKADPTFEGLKQLLYEPQDRVKISPMIPNQKNHYQVIDRVEISNEYFSNTPIYFNENLTCIIGGKSTGKSLLLHNMALALDEHQVKEKENVASTNVKPIQEIKVYWKDSQCSNDQDSRRKITYVPQSYLNKLTDQEEETTEIDELIEEIILQNDNAQNHFAKRKEKIVELKAKITASIIEMLSINDEIVDLESRKIKIGDQDSVQKEITRLETTMNQLSKDFNISEGEVENYQKAVGAIQESKKYVEAIEKEKIVLENISEIVGPLDFSNKGISYYLGDIEKVVKEIVSNANEQWLNERNIIISSINRSIKDEINTQSENQVIVNTLKTKIESAKQLEELSNQVLKEKSKLFEIKGLDVGIKNNKTRYSNEVDSVISSFLQFKRIAEDFGNSVNQMFESVGDDLKFQAKCVFKKDKLKEKIASIFDGRTMNRFEAFRLAAPTEADFADTKKIRSLVDAIMVNSDGSIKLKGNIDAETAFRELFIDWYNIGYDVRMENDAIADMSPGNKALVLLRLLISLAENKNPILIDQPEDDLDNRSIYNELINFLKTKKLERQIIVVTHNANIVLGSDAELVLVANQRGANTPNEEKRFEYRGGAIENIDPVYEEDTKTPKTGVLNQVGIQTHICEILEGGKEAFILRKNKYRL